MIKATKICSLLLLILLFNSCASAYKNINPQTVNYASKTTEGNISLEYRYDLLKKKYKKKETKNGIKLVAVKITNNTERDMVFGRDFKLSYENNTDVSVIETNNLYKTVKQSPASYLWYLLLTPLKFYSGTTTTTNGSYTETKPANSFPIGLILGPAITGVNMLVASSSNKKFKKELIENDIDGKTIKKGETVYGLIGLRSKTYDGIKIKLQLR